MNINERVLKEADYILKTKDTIRQLANIFCISKSTVHKDLKERLKHIDYEKYNEVKKIMEYHIMIRHIRGGESTKNKYLKTG